MPRSRNNKNRQLRARQQQQQKRAVSSSSSSSSSSSTSSLDNPEALNVLRKYGSAPSLFSGDDDGGYGEVTINGVTLSKEQVKESVEKQGSVIVFDSRDWHRITPVTKGTRYSIVCWTVGPNLV